MLRITTHDSSDALTFQLEGKLAGPWVNELENCWQSSPVGGGKVVRIDLNALTFVDTAGKQLLATMHAQGAEFVCTCCLMRALVAEITRAKTGTRDKSKQEAKTN